MSWPPLARLALLVASTGLAGCGYALANGTGASLTPFTVRAAEAKTPDSAAFTAAIEGAQRELARAGLLSARGDGTVLTIAVVRVEERSEGIAAGAGSPASATPFARGIRLTIAGRATAPASPGAASRDSGEIEVAEIFAGSGGAALGVVGRDEAARRAGRRLGERLVRRVLGEIDPGEP